MFFVKKVLNALSAAVYILIVASSPYCRNYIVSIDREIFISQRLFYCRKYCREVRKY